MLNKLYTFIEKHHLLYYTLSEFMHAYPYPLDHIPFKDVSPRIFGLTRFYDCTIICGIFWPTMQKFEHNNLFYWINCFNRFINLHHIKNRYSMLGFSQTAILFTKYHFLTKLTQIAHIHKNNIFSSIIGAQQLLPYKVHGSDMCGMYFFIFASCEPLTTSTQCRA